MDALRQAQAVALLEELKSRGSETDISWRFEPVIGIPEDLREAAARLQVEDLISAQAMQLFKLQLASRESQTLAIKAHFEAIQAIVADQERLPGDWRILAESYHKIVGLLLPVTEDVIEEFWRMAGGRPPNSTEGGQPDAT